MGRRLHNCIDENELRTIDAIGGMGGPRDFDQSVLSPPHLHLQFPLDPLQRGVEGFPVNAEESRRFSDGPRALHRLCNLCIADRCLPALFGLREVGHTVSQA